MKLLKALLVLAMAWPLSGAVLMWTVGEVHDWWSLVPPLSFSVAMRITTPIVVGALISGILQGILGEDD
jgi:hypothetical protein